MTKLMAKRIEIEVMTLMEMFRVTTLFSIPLCQLSHTGTGKSSACTLATTFHKFGEIGGDGFASGVVISWSWELPRWKDHQGQWAQSAQEADFWKLFFFLLPWFSMMVSWMMTVDTTRATNTTWAMGRWTFGSKGGWCQSLYSRSLRAKMSNPTLGPTLGSWDLSSSVRTNTPSNEAEGAESFLMETKHRESSKMNAAWECLQDLLIKAYDFLLYHTIL